MGADAEVVQIRMRGADRRESQQIVNAVAQAYLSEVVNKGNADQLARHKVILKKYGEMMAELGALAAEAKLPANGDADVEARRKKIQQLEDVTNKMALSLEALAAELQTPSRVEAIDVASVGDGAVR
jgi:capsular polysaccharide biosynthesis protein